MHIICANKFKIETDLVTLFYRRDKANRENYILPRNINIRVYFNLFRIFRYSAALRDVLLKLMLIKEDIARL